MEAVQSNKIHNHNILIFYDIENMKTLAVLFNHVNTSVARNKQVFRVACENISVMIFSCLIRKKNIFHLLITNCF